MIITTHNIQRRTHIDIEKSAGFFFFFCYREMFYTRKYQQKQKIFNDILKLVLYTSNG